MTNEEAITNLKIALNEVVECIDSADVARVPNEAYVMKPALEMAIEALERKPITNEDVMRAFGMHTCFPAYDRNAETTIEFIKDCIAIRDFTSKH